MTVPGTTLIMYDSIRAASIPSGAIIVAGYLDGTYNDWSDLLTDFPNVPKVSIDVNGGAPGAAVRDWETGDKGGNLEDWVISHNQLSGAKDAVIYCNRSTIAEVRQLTGSQVLGRDYYLWVATGDGTIYGPDQLAGVIACQNIWTNAFDSSVVWPNANIWWSDGVINPPPPPPPTTLPSNWTYGPVQLVSGDTTVLVNAGPHSFSVEFGAPVATAGYPAGIGKLGITDYQVSVCQGSGPGAIIDGYPRYIPKDTNPQSWQGGGLTPSTQYWFGIRALYQGGHAGPWVGGTFTTSAA